MKPSFLCQFFLGLEVVVFQVTIDRDDPLHTRCGVRWAFCRQLLHGEFGIDMISDSLADGFVFLFCIPGTQMTLILSSKGLLLDPKMEDKWVPGKCWLNKHSCVWLVDMSTDLGGCMRVRLKLGGSSNQWNASRYAGRFFRRATKNSLPIMINVMKQWLNFIVGGFFPILGFVKCERCERELLFSKSAKPRLSHLKLTNQRPNILHLPMSRRSAFQDIPKPSGRLVTLGMVVHLGIYG